MVVGLGDGSSFLLLPFGGEAYFLLDVVGVGLAVGAVGELLAELLHADAGVAVPAVRGIDDGDFHICFLFVFLQ